MQLVKILNPSEVAPLGHTGRKLKKKGLEHLGVEPGGRSSATPDLPG